MDELPLIRWAAPGPYEVAFSTRVGGVSTGAFTSLNLTHGADWWSHRDEPERVEENRRRLCDAVGADPALLALNRQVHSTTVHRARGAARGVPGDGLWSDERGLPMLKLTADCVPIAIARTNGGGRPALAVLHAGRIGLIDGIVEAAVSALGGGRLAAAVGPAIGPCCYEVGEEVATPFRDRFGADILRGRNLDLWTASDRALRDAGVGAIERVDLCTACNPELFFSYRRDGTPRGGQGVIGFVA